MTNQAARILYCHCAYAKVVPPDVKAAVLNGLAAANAEFDAVPDLCEMAARGDQRLRELAAAGPLRIAACYPRAVKWLFAAAGAQLQDRTVRVWNMRVETADTVIDGLVNQTGPTGEPGQDVEPRLDGRSLQGDPGDAGEAGEPVDTVQTADSLRTSNREVAS